MRSSVRRDQLLALPCQHARALQRLAQVQLALQRGGQLHQNLDLVGPPEARLHVDRAQAADHPPLAAQRHARIGAHAQRLHRRHRGEHRIEQRVVDHQRRITQQRVVAEGAPAQLAGLGQLAAEAVLALVEVAVGGHDRHEGDRHAQQRGGQRGQRIEDGLGRRVEQAAVVHGLQPTCVVQRGLDPGGQRGGLDVSGKGRLGAAHRHGSGREVRARTRNGPHPIPSVNYFAFQASTSCRTTSALTGGRRSARCSVAWRASRAAGRSSVNRRTMALVPRKIQRAVWRCSRS